LRHRRCKQQDVIVVLVGDSFNDRDESKMRRRPLALALRVSSRRPVLRVIVQLKEVIYLTVA
jgi:hypothetical protein